MSSFFDASKLCPITIAVLLMASIWLIIAENVWYSVSVIPFVVFSVAISVGNSVISSCVAEAVCWMSAVSWWNCSASWSIPSNDSNMDRNDQQMGISKQCLSQ